MNVGILANRAAPLFICMVFPCRTMDQIIVDCFLFVKIVFCARTFMKN